MRRPPAAPPELPGFTHLGLLGSGGFADVYLYEQRLPRRKVAVKVLLADDIDASTRAQFVAEANLMARLSAHPFIVTIFHADVSADGRPYFVMEYCSGPSLSERYKRQPLSVEDALRTGIRLSGAVATAHAAGILHRDIKPANVLTNDYGWPALSDFGISSDLEGDLPVHTMSFTGDAAATGSGTGSDRAAVGMSVPWSPPELFEDDPRPDTRSDVFALAATVHTLLAGRTPFEVPGRSNGPLDLIGRIERGRITPIGRDDVPASLESVLATGMAVRREDRFQSAVELGRALQRIELELGYSVTGIEVPNLAAPGDGDGVPPPTDADDEPATRVRGVREVAAQGAPAVGSSPVEDGTVIRPTAAAPAAVAAVEGAVDGATLLAHGRRAAGASRPEGTAPQEPSSPGGRRAMAGIVTAVAGIVVIVAVSGALLLGGTLGGPGTDPEEPGTIPEDAVVAASVPAPEVEPGAIADGRAVFTVSHDGAQDGDRYRWQRADGSGSTAVADGPEIVVGDVAAGQTVCIEVQVQRGSKTSEPVTGCTS
ncbi:hypothetical protein GCM10017608_10200 [Agromyces luteolus]|uniref:non-specific serine/threonine protein kinase n=1 Tax=Agromyces luteolus TaxID=88373 RepID=A0A7C9LED8_9MICO|nr:serine/threonine-protein kinase [Agromyces luteolus]MUN08552.1 protein kinase [Agromyces luteolus]GLK27087.1 hypothetical protein GCM10017608_10200 [Agromyces luteolus]